MDPVLIGGENSLQVNSFWIGYSTMLTSTFYFMLNIKTYWSILMIISYGIALSYYLKTQD